MSYYTPKQNLRRRTVDPKDCSLIKRKSLATPRQNDISKTPVVLSQVEKEPKTPTNDEVSAIDPVLRKIQRDFNSPSAAARVRAIRALKSPNFKKANYEVFDVPHEEQDIITDEERKPYVPKTFREVFAKCRVYVEVRTEDDDRSAGIKSKLLADGITVNEKLYKDTTHVIFKDGLVSTYKKAKSWGIPVISILWIEACKKQRRLVDPANFKISNLDRYEHPELYGRVRRQKPSQPEICNKIVVHKKAVRQEPAKVCDETNNDLTAIEEVSDGSITLKDNDETLKEHAGMELTLKNCDTPVQEIIKTKAHINANLRLTTFTPQHMEQTKCNIGISTNSVDRRRTMLPSSQRSEDSSTPLCDSFRKKITFNSANRISSISRRSVLDISMNIFKLNVDALSEKKDEWQDTDENVNRTPVQAKKPTEVRKRKLFSVENDIDDSVVESKENFESPTSSVKKKNKVEQDKSKSVIKPVADRRKTISYFKTEKSVIVPQKAASVTKSTKYIVCTNMSSDQKQLCSAAICKLGGVFENEVSSHTTHVICPNDNAERTMNVLRGIINACFIVKLDWLRDSDKQGRFLDITFYLHDICDTRKIHERSILKKNFKNITFLNYGPFFINKEGIDNHKKCEYLKEIIVKCSGKLVNNKIEAKIVISDRPLEKTASVIKKPTTVTSTYIFDAAMQGRMLPTSKYVPKVQEEK